MRWNGGGKRAVWTTSVEPQNGHPTPKPLSLIKEWILDFTDQNNLVCDPFMGSGTTGVACVQMGRKFIGIERERKYFDIACRRIEEAARQPDMLISAPAVAVQMDMLSDAPDARNP
jgi:DNA modification methylase